MNKQTGFPLFLIVISAIALIIFVLFLLGKIDSLQSKIKSQDSVISEKNAEITYRKNKEGKIIADKQAAEMRANDFVKNYPALAQTIKDMGLEMRSLKAIVQEKIVANGKGNSTITNNYYTDSTGRRRDSLNLNVSDGYLTFHTTVYDSLHAPYKYTYTDVVTMAIHDQKKWVFGREKLYGSAILGNPNSKITNSTNVLIKDYKDKRWSIGPYIGYSIGNHVSAGISIQYAMIKF